MYAQHIPPTKYALAGVGVLRDLQAFSSGDNVSKREGHLRRVGGRRERHQQPGHATFLTELFELLNGIYLGGGLRSDQELHRQTHEKQGDRDISTQQTTLLVHYIQ